MKLVCGLILLLVVFTGCSLTPMQTLSQEEVYVPPPQPTNIPAPGFYEGGFSYYEDPNLGPGFDPVFVVCNGKALKLMQNGQGWNVEHISIEDMKAYGALTATGQWADYGFYNYQPSVGEIYFKDQLVQSFHNEYNPQYWIWAWTSLLFVKDCRLHIYYVYPDTSELKGTVIKQPTVDF